MTSSKSLNFFLAALFLATLIVALNWPLNPIYGGDVEWYLKIFQGDIQDVIQPFSGRIFFPFLAGMAHYIFGIDAEHSFLFITIAALYLLFLCLAVVLKKILPFSLMLAPLLFMPYFAGISSEYLLPDAFFLFSSTLFFVFLFYNQEIPALLTLFFMFLTRESIILFGLIFLCLSIYKGKRMLALGTFFIIAISIFVTGQINSLGIPNAHNLQSFLYFALKIPYYFFNNVLGISLWSNTLANCDPIYNFALPSWLPLGSIERVGSCGFMPEAMLATFVALLTLLGIMPVVIFYLIRRNFQEIFRRLPFWFIVTVAYGASSYLISIFVTPSAERFIGYAASAFILTVPFLMREFLKINRNLLIKLSAIHMSLAWLPFVLRLAGWDYAATLQIFIIVIAIAAYLYTFYLLKGALVQGGRQALAP
ncbi:MAG: hypothetical protein HYT12_02005 [Candidatus Liptonbacteria bacterium]|nr:hypothetical protein [Candidatus Liptonbacteria bacterium]